MAALLSLLAVLAKALGDLAARLTYAALAGALVFAGGQLAGGAPPAQTINAVGWVALALVVARLAFGTAHHLLADAADPGARTGAVTA